MISCGSNRVALVGWPWTAQKPVLGDAGEAETRGKPRGRSGDNVNRKRSFLQVLIIGVHGGDLVVTPAVAAARTQRAAFVRYRGAVVHARPRCFCGDGFPVLVLSWHVSWSTWRATDVESSVGTLRVG